MKTTGRVTVITDDKEEVSDYGIGDEVKISAIGKITELRENNNTHVMVDEPDKTNSKKVKEYVCEIKLNDIELDNISIEDKKEAESENIPLKKYKEIKNLKNSVKAKYDMA